MANLTSLDGQEVLLSVERSFSVRNALVSSVALLVFDYIITFSQEVNLIWSSPWSSVKVLFLINRYVYFSISVLIFFAFANSPSQITCNTIVTAASWTALIGIAIADVILCIRTYAIWGKSRTVLAILMVTYTVGMTPSLVIRVMYGNSLRVDPAPFHVLGCFATKANTSIYVECIFVLFFETIIMFLTSWKAIFHLRGCYASRAPMLVMLFRDGFLYYVLITIITLTNTLVMVLAPGEYVNFLMGFQRALHSILSGRVILHIRETAVGGIQTSEMPTISKPVFTSGLHNIDEPSSTSEYVSWREGTNASL